MSLQTVTRCKQGTGTERERREKRMLIGISIRSVMLISLRLRTNYVITVMRIKDKGDKALNLNQIAINR